MKNVENAKKRSAMDKMLDWIEDVGNKLPEAFIIFVYLAGFMILLSFVLSMMGVSAVHPVTKQTLKVVNLLSAEGLIKILTNAVSGFTGFAPLGVVLVAMLGVGVAEKSGLLNVAIRNGLSNTKGSPVFVIASVVFFSIVSMAAGDSGFIVMPPLGAIVFASIGRNPLAGMMAAYASVAGAFGGNIIPTSLDMLLIGFTEAAVKTSGLPALTNPMMNYYFQLVSVVFVTITTTWVTLKFVEPRLGTLKDYEVGQIEEVTDVQRKGLKMAGLSLLIFLGIVVALTAPANGILREPTTKQIVNTKAPIMISLVMITTLAFFIPGMVFGKITGSIKDSREMVKMMNKSMSELGSYITLVFILALFSGLFTWSNVGIIIAIKGASALQASGFPIPVVIILLVLFIIPLDIFLGSSSAKWAIFAPIFVPMFMFLGFHPAFTQMVYRVGDAVINVCGPLSAYYLIMLEHGKRYDKNLGLGTMVATMLPYSFFFLIGWIIMLLAFFFLRIPMGPGGPILLP